MKHLRKFENENDGYFDGLPQSTRDLVAELIEETADQNEVWTDNDLEEIECRSRDGFIAYSHNRGGLMSRQFTDLAMFDSSGSGVAHKGADAEIKRQIEYGRECARDSFYRDNTERLNELGIKSADDVSYHDLYEMGETDLAEEFDECERSNLSDDQSSIMFEVRFMYHGQDADGTHSASVSCAVNTEGPYHRSGISWAPGVFCEGAKEVEIEWKTDAGLKQKLTRALKTTSGEVF